jgi:outer membrane protein insertion porin family
VRLERGARADREVIERPSMVSRSLAPAMSEDDWKVEERPAEGRVFNKSLLDRVEQELRQQYFARGYYAVTIRPTVTLLSAPWTLSKWRKVVARIQK